MMIVNFSDIMMVMIMIMIMMILMISDIDAADDGINQKGESNGLKG